MHILADLGGLWYFWITAFNVCHSLFVLFLLFNMRFRWFSDQWLNCIVPIPYYMTHSVVFLMCKMYFTGQKMIKVCAAQVDQSLTDLFLHSDLLVLFPTCSHWASCCATVSFNDYLCFSHELPVKLTETYRSVQFVGFAATHAFVTPWNLLLWSFYWLCWSNTHTHGE